MRGVKGEKEPLLLGILNAVIKIFMKSSHRGRAQSSSVILIEVKNDANIQLTPLAHAAAECSAHGLSRQAEISY